MSDILSDDIWDKSSIEFEYNNTLSVFKQKFKTQNINGFIKLSDMAEQCTIDESDVFVTDNLLHCDYLPLWPEYYGAYYMDVDYCEVPVTKTACCFINRTDPFRQSWLYLLIRRNLLDESHVTYNLKIIEEEIPQEIWHKPSEIFEYLYQTNTEFAKEHEIIKTKVPFKTVNGTLEQAIMESKFSIVLETVFNMRHGVQTSEKTFRHLQMPRPFAIFANPGIIKHLKSCGFDVYDDIVDHSYDYEDSDAVRQALILNQAERFRNVEFDANLIDRLHKGCNHNKAVLKGYYDAWPGKKQQILNYLDTIGN